MDVEGIVKFGRAARAMKRLRHAARRHRGLQ